MTADQVLAAIGFIGLGGLLKSLVDFAIASTKAKQDSNYYERTDCLHQLN